MTTENKEYFKKWYIENREEHLKYMQETIKCNICNIDIKRCSIPKHNKSKKHLLNQLVNNKNEEINKMQQKINNIQN